MKNPNFKQDKFRKSRGGWSRIVLVSCGGSDCGEPVLVYKKDGPGMLKRLYLDRILAPPAIAQSNDIELQCPHCPRRLGMQTTWHQEDRPAYQLFAGAVCKSVISADKLEKMKQMVA